MAKEFGLTEAVATAATAGGGIWGFWTKVAKPYMKSRKEKRDEVYNKIAEIHAELKFNGGSSIKDAVLRLERGQQTIITRLDGLDESNRVALIINGTAFWYSNEDGECIYASPGLCKVTGHNESELMGNKWISCVTHGDRKRIFDAWNFSVENRTAFDEVYTFKRADGYYQKVQALCFHKTVNDNHAGSLGKLDAVGEPFK